VIALRDLTVFIYLSLLIHLSYPDSEVLTPSDKAAPAGARTPGRGLGHRLREQETTVTVFNTSAGHAITPLAGSARRVRDGELADLTNPLDYPAEAVCAACDQPIRIERYFLAEWRHIERFTDPAG
jgi:hypothetical protein